jgi:hypothetical protein
MATDGRRKFERYKTRMPVDIVTTSGWMPAVVCDISEAGIGFKSRTFIKADTHVSVRFKGQQDTLFTGWVMWGKGIPDTDGYRYRIGVAFKAIIFAADRIMEMPSKDEMVQKVIAEIKNLGGAVSKR